MKMLPSVVDLSHPDYELLVEIRAGIVQKSGGLERLHELFPLLVQDAIEFVLDPVRTGRTEVHQLDNVEKTFVGLKIEHFVRDLLDAPKGIRDLEINGHDVDVKNTLDNSWMIPPETYLREEVCLVINTKPSERICWLGLLKARQEYLNAPNRDQKRGVRSAAVANVMWLVEAAAYPESRWAPFDMIQFRKLRDEIPGGTNRIAEFFRLNQNTAVHRKVIQALLYPAYDYMKRARGNGGARDILKAEKIAVLSGAYDNAKLVELGREVIDREDLIAIGPRNMDEENRMKAMGIIS